jgi:chorismate mutase
VTAFDETSEPTSADRAIAHERAAIDAIDRELVQLVRQRLEVSRRIQALRAAAGGERIAQDREREVVARWTTEFGQPGAAVADALLALARGPGEGPDIGRSDP